MWIVTVATAVLCLSFGALSIKLWLDVRALKRALAEPPKGHSIAVALKITEHERRLKNLEKTCS